jgi:hypothetical protein
MGAVGYAALGLGVSAMRSARGATSNGRIKIGQIGTAHSHASGKIATIRKYPVTTQPLLENARIREGRCFFSGLAFPPLVSSCP